MQQLNINFIISMFLVILLPSFIFVIFKVSSLSTGIVLASFMLIIMNYKYFNKFKVDSLQASVIVLILLIFFVQSSYSYIVLSQSKPSYSLLFLIVVVAAYLFAQKISILAYHTLLNSMFIIILTLIALGWLKFYYIPFSAYTLWVKQVFPFSEESHYALALGMLTVSYAFVGDLKRILFIILNTFLLAMFFPSLTLFVFTILTVFSSVLRIKAMHLKLLLLISPIFIILILLGLISTSEYFSSRLVFEDTRNLTTLVYLQGWDMAYINLITTKGTGLGFQMLGMNPDVVVSNFTEIIREFAIKDYNLYDGGFLAAKVISEFGIIGVLFILFYIYFIFKCIFNANKIWRIIKSSNDFIYINNLKKRLLVLGIIFSFLIEVFLRGYGYFSPGVFLVLVAIFYLYSNPKEKILCNEKEL